MASNEEELDIQKDAGETNPPVSIKTSLAGEERSSIRILEAKLKALEKLMEECSKEEMTLNEMKTESSAYIKEDYIVRKYMNCWKQYMTAIQKKDGRAKLFKKLKITKSKCNQLNEAVTNHLIKKQKFPDYPEILEVLSNANKEFDLNLNQSIIQYESSEIFFEVGSQLQNGRRRALAKSLSTYLSENSSLNGLSIDDKELTNKIKRLNNDNDKEMEDIFREYSELGILSQSTVTNNQQDMAYNSEKELPLNNSNTSSQQLLCPDIGDASSVIEIHSSETSSDHFV